ncbi:hypothetical protein BDV95DRAFT_598183 [Massariosphaeria phaeospora]|uniref:RTA1 like protein-domain-containing protein n=1 Tax=Massariosphaeria phaeospora TaxID=100035 RepID=A0A7C8I3X8_9PLEO|nr:hypothetical protein BDV95DRAFT_598183 [Massariosphaeria phaeospora]
MADGTLVEGSLYFYAPNKIAAACFTAAFLVSGITHLWQCKQYKSFKVTGLHPLCCLMFTVGFALREWGAFDFDRLYVYMFSQILIMCAPPILELANYHVLGRILYYVPYFSPMHPGRTLTTFGFISGIVEVMNALGVSYIASKTATDKYLKLGHILMKLSLFIQVLVIIAFCLLAGAFQSRCARGGVHTRSVRSPLLTLYMSMMLILVRCVYRIIEHFAIGGIPRKPEPGFDIMRISPVYRYEWYFYVFEATLMIVNTVLWNFRHPRRYLPQDYHVYLAQDGKTELQGPGWKDDVPWIITFLDPCGFSNMLREKLSGASKEQPFWETNGFEHVPLVARGHSNSDGAA